jgi:glycosyltransferase involved in cell wall biosynthesis
MQNKKLLFSLIIPTYNRANFIAKAIQSCLEQEYTHVEILVIDDGSTDNTAQIVQQFTDSRIHYFYKENAERGAARNFGVKQAKGDYVFFLDSDDYLLPNHLSHAHEQLTANAFPELFHSRYFMVNQKGDTLYKAADLPSNINKILLKSNVVGCLLFIKREIALEFPYDENRHLAGTEDKLLALQLAARFTIKISNIPTLCVLEHQERSMNSADVEKWLLQKNILIAALKQDKIVTNKFGKTAIAQVEAWFLQMIAVKLLLAKNKSKALSLYKQSIVLYPLSIVDKNLLRMLKYSLL